MHGQRKQSVLLGLGLALTLLFKTALKTPAEERWALSRGLLCAKKRMDRFFSKGGL